MHLWWQELKKEGEGTVHRFCLDQVVIVEHENGTVVNGDPFIEQGRQYRFSRSGLGAEVSLHKPFIDAHAGTCGVSLV